MQGGPHKSMSHQVCHFPEHLGVFYADPSVVLPGFQMSCQAVDDVFGVCADSDWLVGRYYFHRGNDCGYFADLVGLGVSGDPKSSVPWVALCEPDSTPAMCILFAVIHTGPISVHRDLFASWGWSLVLISSGHLGGVSVWVREDLEAFSKTFFTGD